MFGLFKRLSKNYFGGSLSPLVPLELELCSVDDEADSVAVSIIVSSASLHVADSPDVSSRECNISKAMVLRYTCSSSSISPSEDKDSLCFYRRLLSWRPSCVVFLHYDHSVPSRSLGAFCSRFTGALLEVSSPWGCSLIAALRPSSRAFDR